MQHLGPMKSEWAVLLLAGNQNYETLNSHTPHFLDHALKKYPRLLSKFIVSFLIRPIL